MTREADFFSPPIQPMLPYASPGQYYSRAAQRAAKLGDRYFAVMCVVLLGYALGGRGFAYWGVNPLFIGEIMMLTGVFVILKLNLVGRVTRIREFIPLMTFMLWGFIRTVPFLDLYGKDAIRDGVIWGYGSFAFIIAGLLMSDPSRVQKIVIYYRKFVVLFLIFAPFAAITTAFFEPSLPFFPGGNVPIIQVKGGDLCVHLSGVFCYVVALGRELNPWLISLLIPVNLGLNIQGRAGMVSFTVATVMTMILRPFHPRAMRIFFVIFLGLFFLWASDIHIARGEREISFNMLIRGISSITGDVDDPALEGSKEWRQRWWHDIIGYTIHGPYFWTGKGFGINLATDDGYQVSEGELLRSPHSGHMTMLARGGVPGLSLWIILQLTFASVIVKSYLSARRNKLMNWSGLFLFLGGYWAAFMANTSFDVFIEGPMGGIWLWCIYGAGIGSAWVYKRYPDLLTPVKSTPRMPPVAP